MQKIGQVADANATATGEFTDGHLAQQIPPTTVKAAWLNTLQRELVNTIAIAGEQPDPHRDDQCYQLLKDRLCLPFNPDLPAQHTSPGILVPPEMLTKDGKFVLQQSNPGEITILRDQWFLWRGVWKLNSSQYPDSSRTLTTKPATTYHLRWRPSVGFILYDVTDVIYNSLQQPEESTAMDSNPDDMLIARVVTDSANKATWVSLVNRINLRVYWAAYALIFKDKTLDQPFWYEALSESLTLNWARSCETGAVQGLSGMDIGVAAKSTGNNLSFGVKGNRYQMNLYYGAYVFYKDRTRFAITLEV